jgi:hypothetical protein
MQWQNVNPHGSGNGRLQWKITKKKYYVGSDKAEYEAEVFERIWGKVKELI